MRKNVGEFKRSKCALAAPLGVFLINGFFFFFFIVPDARHNFTL